MTITAEQLQNLVGKVYSNNSDKIGTIGKFYLDDATGEPTWATVKTGLFGTSESFVPLQGGRVDGDDLVVDYDEDTVKGAPRVEADSHLDPQEEEELYAYYGLTDSTPTDGSRVDAATAGTAGRDDRAARLRKYETTDTDSATVDDTSR